MANVVLQPVGPFAIVPGNPNPATPMDLTPPNDPLRNGYFTGIVSAPSSGSFNVRDPAYAGGAVGNGIANDRAAIAAADVAAQVVGGAVFFPPGTYKVASNLTITSPVQFSPGALLRPDNGVTVTLNGAVQAGAYQIFTNATVFLGTIALAYGTVEYVLTEWWGGKSYATVSLADAGIDSTAAFLAACATLRSIRLLEGVYSTQGGHILAANGLAFRGAGQWVANGAPVPQSGTMIHRRSGTTNMLQLSGFVGMYVADFSIDGGAVAGHLLYDNASKYSVVERISLYRAGAASYCLYASAANVNTYRNITCPDNWLGATVLSVGHFYFSFGGGAGYSTFTGCGGGAAGAGGNIRVVTSTGVRFVDCTFDASDNAIPFSVTGNCDSIKFIRCTTESACVATPVYVVDATGAVIYGVTFDECRVSRDLATTQPTFKFVGGAGLTLRGVSMRDTVVTDLTPGGGSAGWANVYLDGVDTFTETNTFLLTQQPVAAFAHDCAAPAGGTRSVNVCVTGLTSRGFTSLTDRWYTSSVTCIANAALQTFIATTTGPGTFIACGALTAAGFDAAGTLIVLGGVQQAAGPPVASFVVNGQDSGFPGAKIAAAGPVGNIIAKERAINATGTFLGYRAIYDAIT